MNTAIAVDDAVRVGRRLAAPPADVFGAWLDPAIARRWLFATATEPLVRAEIDAQVRGAFRFVARHAGEISEHAGVYLEIVPHRRLVFTLQMGKARPSVTRVSAEMAPHRRGCALTVVHEGVARGDARALRDRWTGMLYGLDATLAATSLEE